MYGWACERGPAAVEPQVSVLALATLVAAAGDDRGDDRDEAEHDPGQGERSLKDDVVNP